MVPRRNDTVVLISGVEKGKRGKIREVNPGENTVVVEGLNQAWKHMRKSNKHPRGGRIKIEMPMSASNVRVVCQSCDKPTKVRMTWLDNPQITKKSRTKVATCSKCKSPIRPTQ